MELPDYREKEGEINTRYPQCCFKGITVGTEDVSNGWICRMVWCFAVIAARLQSSHLLMIS